MRLSGRGADRGPKALSHRQVVGVVTGDGKSKAAEVEQALVVVDCDVAAADDLERVTAHHDGRAYPASAV